MPNDDCIGAGTGRLGVNSSATEWVQHAIDQHWPHSSTPTVFMFTESKAKAAVPQIERAWPTLDLTQQTNDAHPALNPCLCDPMAGRLLPQLAEGLERNQRLRAFASAVRSEIATWEAVGGRSGVLRWDCTGGG